MVDGDWGGIREEVLGRQFIYRTFFPQKAAAKHVALTRRGGRDI